MKQDLQRDRPRKNKRKQNYERKAVIYDLQSILSQVVFKPKFRGRDCKVDFDGDMINMASDRYKCFAQKGTKCVECGIEGVFFAKERDRGSSNGWHFNLYAVRDGKEILMTKDHIIPIAKGGTDSVDNYQTMCAECNSAKDAELQALEKMNEMFKNNSFLWIKVDFKTLPPSTRNYLQKFVTCYKHKVNRHVDTIDGQYVFKIDHPEVAYLIHNPGNATHMWGDKNFENMDGNCALAVLAGAPGLKPIFDVLDKIQREEE